MSTTEIKDGKIRWRGNAAEGLVEHRHCDKCGSVYFPVKVLATVCESCGTDLPV